MKVQNFSNSCLLGNFRDRNRDYIASLFKDIEAYVTKENDIAKFALSLFFFFFNYNFVSPMSCRANMTFKYLTSSKQAQNVCRR